MTVKTKAEYERSVEERFARIGSGVDRVVAAAEGLTAGMRDEFFTLIDELREDREIVGARFAELRRADEQAWSEYRQATAAALERFEADLIAAEHDLKERRAASQEEFARAVEAELDDWRARIDEWRVQTALGRMESRDDMERLVHALEERRDKVGRRLERLERESSESWTTLRAGVREALDGLRSAVRDAAGQFV